MMDDLIEYHANRIANAYQQHIGDQRIYELACDSMAFLVRQAVEAERERCAMVVQNAADKIRFIGADDARVAAMHHMAVKLLDNAAAAIRAVESEPSHGS